MTQFIFDLGNVDKVFLTASHGARVSAEFRVVLVSDVNVPADLCLWLQSESCSMTFDYSPVHVISGFALVITDIAIFGVRSLSCQGSLQSVRYSFVDCSECINSWAWTPSEGPRQYVKGPIKLKVFLGFTPDLQHTKQKRVCLFFLYQTEIYRWIIPCNIPNVLHPSVGIFTHSSLNSLTI